MDRMHLLEEPTALVQAPVHPVKQEVIQHDEEQELQDDDPPGG